MLKLLILPFLTLGLAVAPWRAHAASGPPVITSQPASQTVLLGNPVTFTVGVDGTPPFLYQWLRNGGVIAGATSASYTLATTAVGDQGSTFSVLVTNSLGNAASANAVLQIDPGVLTTNLVSFIALEDTWRFSPTGTAATNLGTAWRSVGYDDSQFGSGRALLLVEDNVAVVPRNTILGGTAGSLPTTYYFRAHFTNNAVTNAPNIVSVRLLGRLQIDDGAVCYLNGTEAFRLGMPAGAPSATTLANRSIGDATSLEGPFDFAMTNLVSGDNLMAVEVHQQTANNADIVFGMTLDLQVVTRNPDHVAPVVVQQLPPPGTTVRDLYQVEVFFSEPVNGVDASDLLLNGVPATGLTFGLPGQFTFDFPLPAPGLVQVSWALNHGIRDLAVIPNDYVAVGWTYTIDPTAPPPQVSITEFSADNQNIIHDEDGDSSDWIELYNAGATAVSLNGWFLTDQTNNLTKWRIPAVALQAGGPNASNSYIVVFASGKNRATPPGRLHTNFQLGSGGEYLALVDAQTNIVSEFYPTFPEQFVDVSYGRDVTDPNLLGYFQMPTPGRRNSTAGAGFAPRVDFSRQSGTFLSNAPFSLTLSTPLSNAVIYYMLGTNAASSTNVPGSNSVRYTAPIPISRTTLVRARAFAPNLFAGPVRTESYIALSPASANLTYVSNVVSFASPLPIMILHNFGGGAVPSGSDQFVVVQTFEPENGPSSLTNKPVLAERGIFHLRGSSTLGYAKGSFFMELRDEFGNDKNVPLLGLPEDSDWVLYAPNNFEPALFHNPLAFRLARDLGEYASRTRFVEVYLKDETGNPGPVTPNDYNGIYVLQEKIKIDKNRVDIDVLQAEDTNAPAVTGGYMFSIDRTAPGEQQLNAGGTGMNWIDPKYKQIIDSPSRVFQSNYIRQYFNDFNTQLNSANWTNASGYAAYINVDSWTRRHIHEVLTFNVDALRLSGYFFKGRDTKIEYGPAWDYDRTQGSTDGRDSNPRTWRSQSGDLGTDFFNFTPWWARLNSAPDFWQRWIDQYAEFRKGPLSQTNIFARIEQMATELRPAQQREQRRWNIAPRGTNGTGTGTYETEVQWKRNWYANRLNFMDTNFLRAPVLGSAGGVISSGFALSISDASGKANTTIYYTLDGSDPRGRGGAIASNAQVYSGPITLTKNARVIARARNPDHRNLTGANNPPISSPWSAPTADTYYTQLPPLRITEIMFHPYDPATGTVNDPDGFEYIEVKNISGLALNVKGFRLSGGIDFTFPDLVLQAGQSAVVVKDLAAFQSRYGISPNILVAGVFTGTLDNAEDHIVLEGNLREPIHDFSYDDDWYRLTDGTGFSLVIADENASPAAWGSKTSWRPSTSLNGSPGQTDPLAPPRPSIVINEALTHTDLPAVDVVELYNPTASDVSLAGWFLTDDFNEPMKFVIPSRTIPAHGYITFSEEDFNPGGTGFALSSSGDELYLFSGNGTDLTGYVHGFDFGAAANGVTFGRYVISTGDDQFVAQSSPSLSQTNAGPRVGPVVISEIMYHPADVAFGTATFNNVQDEYIELQNVAATNVPLYDLSYPSNTWHLRDAVDFNFPPSVMLAPGSFLMVVNFDPIADPSALAGFRARNFVPESVPVYGPWRGNLDNQSGDVELRRPDVPNTNDVPYILVERVKYSDEAPWPVGADGLGLSLQRIGPTSYGNDPINWAAAAPTAGGNYVGGIPPAITSQPGSQLLVTGRPVQFAVTATGTEPIRYQWRLNGFNIAGATSPTYAIANLQPTHAGVYSVFLYNGGGSVVSSNFTVTLRTGLEIVTQPANRLAQLGQNTNFTVSAVGSGILRYQWRFNGNNIANATTATYLINNVQSNHVGEYRVQVSDDFDSFQSQPATLTLIFRPVVTLQPRDQSVVSNGTANFTIAASGTTPITFRWRKNNITIPSGIYSLSPTSSTLILPNVTSADVATYNVAVTNIAGQATALSSNAMLTLLLDSDGDGIPDNLEPIDGAADSDGDGMTNAEEVFAGTDHLNPASYLKVEIARTGVATLRFNAVSNRNYSVQYTDGLNPALWKKLADVLSAPATRLEVLSDPAGSTNRLYRLATPIQPSQP